jgi:hypothetical protein
MSSELVQYSTHSITATLQSRRPGDEAMPQSPASSSSTRSCSDAAVPEPTHSATWRASQEFLGQRDDDARRASHIAESVLVLVLGHFADEFAADGAQASDSVVDAFDCKHDAP